VIARIRRIPDMWEQKMDKTITCANVGIEPAQEGKKEC
jgi:hypothetical protein